MDIAGVITRLEATLAAHVRLAGGDEAVDEAAATLLSALEPAVRQATLDLAEQAAAEVVAQAPHLQVEVVLRDGEPMLHLRTEQPPAPVTDQLEARLTLRLPEELKREVQELADATGDSVNSWVVRTLAGGARSSRAATKGRTGTSGEFLT